MDLGDHPVPIPCFMGRDIFPYPHLNLLQQLYILLMLGKHKLCTIFQTGSHKSRVDGENHLFLPAGHTPLDAAQVQPLNFPVQCPITSLKPPEVLSLHCHKTSGHGDKVPKEGCSARQGARREEGRLCHTQALVERTLQSHSGAEPAPLAEQVPEPGLPSQDPFCFPAGSSSVLSTPVELQPC